MTFTEESIEAVWRKGRSIPGYSPDEWRWDEGGRPIKRSEYGNRNSDYGWEIDHIVPVAQGGPSDLLNLRPLQWRANVQRGNS